MGLLAALAPALALYLLGVRRARRWPARRTAAFVAGVAALAAALAPPLHDQAGELLSAHMAQHLLLTLVAPPLLLAGAPVSLAMRALPAAPRRSLARGLHGPAGAALRNPAVGWLALSAVLVGTHAPVFYDAALRFEALHALEHALYLSAALLFWTPILESEPLAGRASPLARILALLAAMPPMALVGIALMTAGEVLYPSYGAGAAALEDQRSAGTLMWIGGTALLAAVTLALGWGALRREEEHQRLREAYADRRARAAPPPEALR